MSYASKGDGGRGYEPQDPSEIDTSLPIAFTAADPTLPYWPWYARLSAAQRGLYLKWLASGRATWPDNDGYAFLYFYGLERRVLVDKADWAMIADEVQRLRRVERGRAGEGTEGRSFRRYSSGFLWYIVAEALERLDERTLRSVVDATEPDDDQSLSTLLGWFASRKQPLPEWAAFQVAGALPASQRSVVVKRVPEEFRRLFEKRFKADFPTGLPLRAANSPRRIEYRPASAALNAVWAWVPDVWGMPSQFRPLSEIWNSCIDDLRQLSRADRGGAAEPITVEAWEALPPELQAGTEHPLTKKFCAMVAERTRSGGCVAPAGALAAIAGQSPRPKLTTAQSQALVNTLECVGYCVEPDPRVSGRGYGWDEPVSLFARWDDSEPDPGRYQAAALMLRMGISVAQADGKVDDQERAQIARQIEEAFNLSAHEKKRLDALRHLIESDGSDTAQVSKKLTGRMEPLVRQAVGRLLVAIAAADGVITQDELGVLKRGFKMLELPPEVLDRTIREVMPARGDGLVTVQTTVAGAAGEALPELKPAATETLLLNREAIRAIMLETRQVSAMLAAAMQSGEDEPVTTGATLTPLPLASTAVEVPASTVAVINAPICAGLPQRYTGFYAELIAQGRWSRDAATALASKHSVMLAGAVEAINEWAFEEHGHAVLDDLGAEIVVDPNGI